MACYVRLQLLMNETYHVSQAPVRQMLRWP